MSNQADPEHDASGNDPAPWDIARGQRGASSQGDNDQAMADDNETNLSVQVTLARSPRQCDLTLTGSLVVANEMLQSGAVPARCLHLQTNSMFPICVNSQVAFCLTNVTRMIHAML